MPTRGKYQVLSLGREAGGMNIPFSSDQEDQKGFLGSEIGTASYKVSSLSLLISEGKGGVGEKISLLCNLNTFH